MYISASVGRIMFHICLLSEMLYFIIVASYSI